MNDTTLGNKSLLPFCVSMSNRDVTLIPNIIGPILRLPLNVYILQLIISGNLITSEFYTLKEAIFEIIICIYDILGMAAYISPNSCLLTIQLFFLGFIVSGRPFLLMLICVERYLAVAKPVVFLRFKPLRYKLVLSGVIWLWTLVSCFSIYIIGSAYHYAAVVQMTAFCVVKLTCCVATLLVLKQPGPGEGKRQKEGMSHIKLKAFRIILIITVSVILVNVPLIVVVFLKNYLKQHLFKTILRVCYTFTALSGLVHGMMFLHRSGLLDGKMDGNHSLLAAISFVINCEDAQSPFIINIVLGLPANMCVMWFILAGLREKAPELSYLNQAICEVVVSVASAMQLFAMSGLISKFVNLTYLEYTMRFLFGYIFSGRPLFMSCICLERYLAVVHPVTFLKYKLLRYRLAETVISWLIVLLCCIILTLVPQPAIAHVCFSMSFSLFLVQVFCCVGSLCALMQPRPGDRNGTSNRMNTGKLNAFRIILIVLVTEAMTFVPYFIAIIFSTLLSNNQRSMMFCIASYASVMTGLITPFHYIYKAGKLEHCFINTANLKLNT